MDKSHRLCWRKETRRQSACSIISVVCGSGEGKTLGLGTGGKENVWQVLVEQGTWEETSWGDGNVHHLNLGCDCMVYTYVKKHYCIVQLRLVYFTVCRLQYSIVRFWVLLEYCSVFLLGTLYKAPVFKDLIFLKCKNFKVKEEIE